jgi:hypothetical protein
VRTSLLTTAIFLLGATLSAAPRPSQLAEHAFESHIANLEARLARQHASPDTFIAVLSREGAVRANAERELIAGTVRVEQVNGGSWQVNGGLLHHWRAAAFVPDASPKDMLALLNDYNNLSRYYSPEVVSSHALANDGTMTTLAMRLKKQRVVTVVLDAEFEIESGLAGSSRGYSFSRSSHIWQIDQPGTERERRLPETADDGFLSRLNSYWSFEQTSEGLLIECEAVSRTRAVPTGLGWLIMPIIETLPRDSLQFTLTATKNALAANAMRRHTDAHPK